MSTCVHCGAVNRSADRICAACGKALADDLSLVDDLINAGIVCPNCDAYNEPNLKNCISCGESLAGMTEFLHAVSGPISEGPNQQKPEPHGDLPEPAAQPPHPSAMVENADPEPNSSAYGEHVDSCVTQENSFEKEDSDDDHSSLAAKLSIDNLPMPDSIVMAGGQSVGESADNTKTDSAPSHRVDPVPVDTPPVSAALTPEQSKAKLIDAFQAKPQDYVSTTATLLEAAERVSDHQSASPAEETLTDHKPARSHAESLTLESVSSDQQLVCSSCQAVNSPDAQFCLECGQAISTKRKMRLRLVRCYAAADRVDQVIPIEPGGLTIGRSQASLCIADDPYLSPRHLALKHQADRLMAQDLGSFNGSFIRIRDKTEIKQNAEFLVGSQRFCFLGLGGPTRDARITNRNDTRSFGGEIPRRLFVALRLLHSGVAGQPVVGSVFLRQGPLLTVGQRNCDLNFPDDAAMSPVHLELHIGASGVHLVPKNASAEVFVAFSGETAIRNGDELLVGAEVLRVEF